MKKILKTLNIITALFLILTAAAIAYIAVPIFGNQALIVRSGSMMPTIDIGSIVVTRAGENYGPGDVIAFRTEKDSKTIVTHRITETETGIDGTFYQTKGDANKSVDGWSVDKQNVLGKVYFTLPYVGQILAFAKTKLGMSLLIILPAVMVILLELFNIIKEIRKKQSPRHSGLSRISDVSAESDPGRASLARMTKNETHTYNKSIFGPKIVIPVIIACVISIPTAYAFLNDTETSTGNIIAAANSFNAPSTTPTPTPEEIQPGDVVINEIMWMGTSINPTDEWIELRNTTSSTVDLSDWIIERLGPGINNVTIPAGQSISPNGFYLIANNPKETGAHNVDPDLVINISIFNEPSEQLVLRTSSGGTIIDTADNNSGGWFAGVNGTGQNPDKSMERNNTPGDGTVSTNWHTATTSFNLDPSASDSATPKAANGL